MKSILPVSIALLVVACSSKPKILPRNEINEPVFHQTHYADLGLASGSTWSRYEPYAGMPWSSAQGGDLKQEIYASPRFLFQRTVSSWASFTLLPVYWNFLLTGNQYADSANLGQGRLHLGLHGGLNGFSFSQRDGWVFTGDVGIGGKYLLDARWFLEPTLSVDFPDLADLGSRIGSGTLSLGLQADARNSLRLTYGFQSYALPERRGVNYRGILFEDGDSRTLLGLRHSFYAGRKHVFGPEAGFTYRNLSPGDNYSIHLGAHYRFVFE